MKSKTIRGLIVVAILAVIGAGLVAANHTHAKCEDCTEMPSLLNYGQKLTEGTHTLSCSADGASDTGILPWIAKGFQITVSVGPGGDTLTIPCDCPPGQSGPCAWTLTWDGSSYKGTTQGCAGGSGVVRKFAFDSGNKYVEACVEPNGQTQIIGMGSRSTP